MTGTPPRPTPTPPDDTAGQPQRDAAYDAFVADALWWNTLVKKAKRPRFAKGSVRHERPHGEEEP